MLLYLASSPTILFDGSESDMVATLDGERPLLLPADSMVATTLRECRARL